jgi:hypothetical protein
LSVYSRQPFGYLSFLLFLKIDLRMMSGKPDKRFRALV